MRGERLEDGRVRRRGGGRRPISETDPKLLEVLEALVADDCRGDPMQVLLWTSKSVRKLAGELRERGHEATTRPSPGCCARSATACLDLALSAAPQRSRGAETSA
ncbi:MAG: hypothetical protein LC777_02660 [Actinobacteria bacterium]|nr:hypothetical protein [Actinomycetota bacterium]